VGDPSPRSLIDTILRAALVLMVASIALTFAVNTLRCVWPWIVGVGMVVGMVALAVWWVRGRGSGW